MKGISESSCVFLDGSRAGKRRRNIRHNKAKPVHEIVVGSESRTDVRSYPSQRVPRQAYARGNSHFELFSVLNVPDTRKRFDHAVIEQFGLGFRSLAPTVAKLVAQAHSQCKIWPQLDGILHIPRSLPEAPSLRYGIGSNDGIRIRSPEAGLRLEKVARPGTDAGDHCRYAYSLEPYAGADLMLSFDDLYPVTVSEIGSFQSALRG